MNTIHLNLAVSALLVASTAVHAAPVLLPNGDFSTPDGATWAETSGGGTFVFSYPTSGGVSGGYGVIDHSASDGGFGIWVANGGAPLPLDSLGLAGGDTVIFSQDMRIEAESVGSTIGGLKVEFLAGATFLGDTMDMIPDLIGDGSTWENYSFEVVIPETADNIKVVPLWGVGSTIGYDNMAFAPAVPEIFEASITLGTAVSWSPTSETNAYQPQRSLDGTEWVDLAEPIVGTAVNAVCDTELAPFYRVLETTAGTSNLAINGGFETPNSSDPTLADSWTPIGSQPPVRITTDFRTDSAAMRIKAQNDAGGAANNSEIQQGIPGIVPGESYDLSFWAKQLLTGVSYVQQYRLQWLDDGGAIVSEAFGFTAFTGGSGDWAEISNPGLVAPAGATTALIQIFGATGAVAGATAQGEVLIDDLALLGSSATQPAVESVINGDFEILDLVDPDCSESWTCGGTQPPLNVVFDSRSGIASMQLQVENDGSATPNSSLTQHNIADAGGTITPGMIYDFSFWAKQVSSGVSYVQQYRLEWRDQFGAVLPGGIGLTPFPGGNGEWVETSVPGLMAPDGAATAFIELIASTGAVAGSSSEGNVLIDDVSLTESNVPVILPATVGPGLKISWPAETGKDYQVECSTNLSGFEDLGSPISGDGNQASVTELLAQPAKFYRVIESTP